MKSCANKLDIRLSEEISEERLASRKKVRKWLLMSALTDDNTRVHAHALALEAND